MCEVGDIIVVNNYNDGDKKLSRHSFVILSNEAGEIQGLDYDIVCNVMSSFKDEDHRKKKLSYPSNFPIDCNNSKIQYGNKKTGYIKAEQLYYFNKEKIDYIVIGSMNEDAFDLLVEFIQQLEVDIKHIIDNL